MSAMKAHIFHLFVLINGEKQLSSIDTGDGVDDLNYSPTTHTLCVGSAKDAKLTVALVDVAGKLRLVAQVPTHQGIRNEVVTRMVWSI
jgi:hypothetical protein